MPQCWAQLMMMTITVAATMMSLISRVSGQQQDFNVLFINEQNNTVAKAAFDAAVTFIKSRGSAVARARTGKITEIVNVKKNSYDFVNTTCQQIDSLVNAGTPPHLIVDTTLSGVSSEIVKAVAKALQIPTMSASYGHDNDITEWRDVSVNQEKYLVQIMPPGDIMTDVIRNIVSSQNITSAAVLYDDTTFVMEHRYKSLLVNLPVRHIISAMDKTEAGLRNQTARIRDADVSTFFLVGSKDSITRALSVATAENMFGKKYAWFALTKDTAGLSCASCRNATLVYMRPTPTAAEFAGKVQQLGQANGLTATPTIDAAFYFDIILTAFRAVTKLVDDGSFKNYTVTTCAAYDKNAQPLDRMTIDLRAAAKAMTSNPATDLTYGRFVWDRNGKSFQELKLTLDKFKFSSGAAMASDGERLGVWLSGLLSGVMTMEPGKNLSEFQAISVYRVTTVITPPFMMKRVHPNGTVEYYGYCVDLINAIRNIVVFDYELYEAPDGKFGSMSDSSEWSGMIKELIDKKADIALAPLSVMAERENVVDFTVPYYDLVGITILMKKSKATTSLFKFLTVLETDVWFCILAAYFFTSFLLWIFDRYSPYSYQNNRLKYEDDDEKREFNLKECLWFCMTSLTPQSSAVWQTIVAHVGLGIGKANKDCPDDGWLLDQPAFADLRVHDHPWFARLLAADWGGGEAPKNLSGRLVAATWWLFGFIIIASYTANLAAFLTVSRLDTPIESLDDLSKQYKVRYAPMNGSSSMTYFERMAYIESKFYEIWKDMSLNDSMSEVERAKLAVWDYPVSDKYTKMWQSMQETGLPKTFADALAKVRDSDSGSGSDGFAYLGDATDIRYQVLTNCDLQMVGDEFSRKPYAIAVQQGSPLKEQFNDAILKLLNLRELESLKERWWNQNPEKMNCDDSDDQSDGISIYNIGGVFIVIFVGIVLACFTLAFEYWYYKYRKPNAGGVLMASSTASEKVFAVREAADPYSRPTAAAAAGDLMNNAAGAHHRRTNFNTDFQSAWK